MHAHQSGLQEEEVMLYIFNTNDRILTGCWFIRFINIIKRMIRSIRIDKIKIKNKKYVQSNSLNITQIKQNSKESFEKLIENNEDFDDYISNYSHIQLRIISECFNSNHKIPT